MRALDDPARFSKTAAMRFHASRNAGGNVALMQDPSVRVVIATTIRVDAFGVAQWPTANTLDRHDRLDQLNQLPDVIAVAAGRDSGKRRAVGVDGEAVFGARSSAIGGVRASFSPAPTARIDDEPTAMREKSIWLAARSFASSSACNASHTPSCCQSRSRRQRHSPEQHPIFAGRLRRRMIVFGTDMPVCAARSDAGVRRRSLAGGKGGSISFHGSSSMIGLPISLVR